MVRSVAERISVPAGHLLEEFGDMMILTGKTIWSALRPPYPYGGEFVSQFLFALRLVWFPLLISSVAVSYGAPGLQAANFLTIFGALDRLGGFFVLAAIREIGPLITSIVLAGVAGTAITADLGARKVREELDALQVLGVDPVKNLVVPRFLADLARAEIGGDRRAGHAGEHDRGDQGADFADRREHEEPAEPVERTEDPQEVRSLQPGGAVVDRHRRNQQREPHEAQREQELGDQLAAIRVRGPQGGPDRPAREDHHVPDFLHRASRGEVNPFCGAANHLCFPLLR